MRYRKFKADQLFNGFELLTNEHVLITTEYGKIENLVHHSEAGDDIENLEGILSPGFINCHCHLELSHMKNAIPEKTGLVDFVYKVVTERNRSEEEIQNAIETAEAEMVKNGVVAVGDICNNSSTLTQKQKQNLQYYNFIEASGWLPGVAATRFDRAKKLFDEFAVTNPKSSVVPHAPYSVSEPLWKNIRPYFENKTVSIHNQETVFEDEFFLEGTGDLKRMYEMMNIDNTHHQPTKRSSLQSYFGKLINAKNILLVHNTFIRQEDIEYVKSEMSNVKTAVFFCLCINANLFIENCLPPVELLLKNNCNIVLGTDSLASNWSLSILDEIKTISKNFPSVQFVEILKWATINGAKALEMDDKLGSFEKGKLPGIVLIKKDLSALRVL